MDGTALLDRMAKSGRCCGLYGVDGLHFKVGARVLLAVEDESDGYRSSLGALLLADPPPGAVFFRQPVATVRVVAVDEGSGFCGHRFIDGGGHCWLSVGTDRSDDYHPSFVFCWEPSGETLRGRAARAVGGPPGPRLMLLEPSRRWRNFYGAVGCRFRLGCATYCAGALFPPARQIDGSWLPGFFTAPLARVRVVDESSSRGLDYSEGLALVDASGHSWLRVGAEVTRVLPADVRDLGAYLRAPYFIYDPPAGTDAGRAARAAHKLGLAPP